MCTNNNNNTITSNFEFTNALDRENYKAVTVHTNNTNKFSKVTNALQGRRQRRSNLCGCNSGNNNNNRTRSVENAGCGRARWHENVKELREQERELVARFPSQVRTFVASRNTRRRPLCPRPNPLSKNFVRLGIEIPRVLMRFTCNRSCNLHARRESHLKFAFS
jgi:hypothetical protein